MKLNSNIITKHLMRWVASNTSEVVVPNYYIGRWECDVLKISRAGHLYEYEVKVSKADFKNDAEKAARTWRENVIIETKHDNIKQGKRVNRFYFVVPEGLIQPEEVPAGFGLIYAKEYTWPNSGKPRIGVDFRIVKVSALFKKESCTMNLYKHIAQNLSIKLANAKHKK